ncbi:Spore germination protein YndE [Paenibacillus plantiphilus]|uniref:Spore germination protein YndE n=1 Tax=Paenibacillus plantiphilus TaxID=2905650 RepID=A0ABM9CQJ7_9BACL|nr:spore germination protein [Paenibacillus plantiphilus]CAH1219190.1 Spore germination protein YndE [Paenibacillus plantiphilus]
MDENDYITPAQVAVVIINAMLGAGILTLPRTTVNAAHTPDVWLSIMVGGFVIILFGMVLVRLGLRYRGQTFYQYVSRITGRWIGAFLSLVVIVYFMLVASFEVRALSEVTGLYLLEGTPSWAIIMPFLWVGGYLIRGGVSALARLCEVILPITGIIFFLTMFLSFGIFDIHNMRPVLGLGMTPVLKGIEPALLSFIGFETIIVLQAFMKKPEKAAKSVIAGILIPTAFYVTTVVMVIGALTVDGVVTKTWPTMDLIRSFELSGLIFERFESFLLVIWIMQIYSTFTITCYASALGIAQLTGRNLKSVITVLLPVIYILSMAPHSLKDLNKLGDMLGLTALCLFGLLPLLLLILSKWKAGKKDGTVS